MPFLDPAGEDVSPESGFGGEVGEMDEESLHGGNGIAPGIGTGAEVHIEAGFLFRYAPGCPCDGADVLADFIQRVKGNPGASNWVAIPNIEFSNSQFPFQDCGNRGRCVRVWDPDCNC